LTAILGTYLFTQVVVDQETPRGLVVTHGGFAAVGLVLLLLYSLRRDAGPIESLTLLAVAATGAILLVVQDVRGTALPRWLAAAHGSVAAAAFFFLLLYNLKLGA
ncbi:MAG TPA: hypothetical protein VL588_10880, partial [Bdellovibrionota bacterium]|nr:hypothetical protein [Bdellovibrionota bacterium]